MKNLSLNLKFKILGGVFFVVLCLQIFFSLFVANKITDNSARIHHYSFPVVNKVHDLKLASVQVQQWLTDISATRATDGLDDGFEQAQNHAQQFRALIPQLKQLDPGNTKLYQNILSRFEAYYANGVTMAKAYIAEGPAGGNKHMPAFDEQAEKLVNLLDPLVTGVQQTSDATLNRQDSFLNSMKSSLLISSLILLILLGIFLWFNHNVFNKLPGLSRELNDIANGRLSGQDIRYRSNDELGALFSSMNNMRAQLKQMIGNITQSATRLNDLVNEMKNITDHSRAAIASEQTDVSQIVTAITQMSATAQEVARNAAQAASAVNEADREANEGYQVVGSTISTINTLADEVINASNVIQKLQTDSENIGGILDVIRGIAEQTNLLALNAAIEAARAGEQGRGFAVVADEVRTLAQRTQQSTQEIQEMIERLQVGADNAVQAMEKGRAEAQASVTQARNAGKSLQRITETISTITDMNNLIATASEQQSAVAEDINRNIVHINDTTEQAVYKADQAREACEQITFLARELGTMVAQFK